jgi:hypothetical protein
MEICDYTGVDSLAEKFGFPSPYVDDAPEKYKLLSYHFETEDHTSSPYPLARFMSSVCASDRGCLTLVYKTRVWNSGRDEHLISLVLADCFKEQAHLFSDGGAFIWSEAEIESARTLIHLAMIFGWDMYLNPYGQPNKAFVSHDGFINFCRNSDALAREFTDNTGRTFTITEID